MDINRVQERAGELFQSELCCSESVLKVLTDELNINSQIIPQIASGFCGGISRTKNICGAVSGGIMVLGMVYGQDSSENPNDKVYEKLQSFLQKFEEEFGSTNCFDLTGCDFRTEKGRLTFNEEGIKDKCTKLTSSAAAMVAQLIKNDGKNKFF
jgi:C_GCAxxG_C_C family probable redox protein